MAGIHKNLRKLYLDKIRRLDIRTLSPVHRLVVAIVRLAHNMALELAEGNLNLRAMSLVYATILSLVPLLAVSFSLLKVFGVHNQVEPMLRHFLEPLGDKGVEFSQRILGFVENSHVWVLGSLGLAMLIYTVVSLVQKSEEAFSGFAIFIMLMIWLYTSWLILLLGSQIAYYHQYPTLLGSRRGEWRLSNEAREQVGILAMLLIGYNYYLLSTRVVVS